MLLFFCFPSYGNRKGGGKAAKKPPGEAFLARGGPVLSTQVYRARIPASAFFRFCDPCGNRKGDGLLRSRLVAK